MRLRPHRRHRLPLLGAILLLAACAHAQTVADADLSGRWEGTATPRGGDEDQAFGLRLDLVVTDGRVAGSGHMIPAGGLHREGRPVRVEGEFQGRRAFLRFDAEGMRAHVLRVILSEPDRLEGSLDMDSPGGMRPLPGQRYPIRVVLTRGGA
jgi:hypothetical protein